MYPLSFIPISGFPMTPTAGSPEQDLAKIIAFNLENPVFTQENWTAPLENITLHAEACSLPQKHRISQILINIYPLLSELQFREAAYKCFLALHDSGIAESFSNNLLLNSTCDSFYHRYKVAVSYTKETFTATMCYGVNFDAVTPALELIEKLAHDKLAIKYSSAKLIDQKFLEKFGKHITLLDLRSQNFTGLNDQVLANLISKCKNIQTLVIKSAVCTNEGLKGLHELHCLKVLNLYGCTKINDIALPKGLNTYTSPTGETITYD